MYYIYVIKSIPTNKYYIGSTNNVIRRLNDHNSGLSKYTRNKGPWVLKYTEEFATLTEARKREKQIKSWKKRAAIEKLIFGPIV